VHAHLLKLRGHGLVDPLLPCLLDRLLLLP